jgi:hypothetical protein
VIIEGGDRIAAGRTRALGASASLAPEYVAWFDDDDWSSPDRLSFAVAMMEANPQLSAVGNVRSWFISTATRKAIEYQAPEGIIFNGAVFRRSHVPSEFAHGLMVGEDTEWLSRYMRGFPTYLIRGTCASAWLCHGKNITNKVNTRAFEQTPPELMTLADWSLVP